MKRIDPATNKGGWWVDETLHKFKGALPTSWDRKSRKVFRDWFRLELGKYRSAIKGRAAMPAPTTELDELLRTQRLVEQTHSALAILPPRSRAVLQTVGLRESAQIGATWGELEKRLSNDLMVAGALLGQVARALGDAKVDSRGRPKSTARDALLAAVVANLRASGMKAEEARETASQILVRCQIQSPSDSDRLKTAVRRGRKRTY